MTKRRTKNAQADNSKGRRRLLLDSLPDYNWDIVKAGIAAGYSESYAKSRLQAIVKSDADFCIAMQAKSKAIALKTVDRRERRLRTLDKIIDDPDAAHRDIVAAVQVQGRMCGWLSETIRTETTERQAQLDKAAQAEATRLALLALDTRQLPSYAKPIQSETIDSDYIPEPESTE